jgi:alpha,alpha-trehalase
MPYGWAPVNWLSIAGLDRYGYHDDAVRISQEFSKSILDNFLHDGTIREKYNVAEATANIKVAAGYKANVVGFGWTNGVYLKMQDLIAAEPNGGATTSAK